MSNMCLIVTPSIKKVADQIKQEYPKACERNGFTDQMCAEWVGLYNNTNSQNPDNVPSMKSLVNFIEKLRNQEGKSFLRDLEEEKRQYDIEQEMVNIKARAIADGTFMIAPNGKPTNLTERQWLQVRTKAFKKWFGDWETIAKSRIFTASEAYKELEKYANDGDGVHARLIRFFIDNFKNDIETYIPRLGSGMFKPDSKEILFPKYEWAKEDGEWNYLQGRKVALHELIHSITAHLLVGYYVAKDKKYEKELRDVGLKGEIPTLSETQIKAFDKLVEIKKKVSKYFDEHPKERNNTTPFENNTYYRLFENDYNGLELDEFISEAFFILHFKLYFS